MILRRILVVAAMGAAGLLVNTVPAHATPALCTVNGTSMVDDIVEGTSGPDNITCTAVPVGAEVRGLAGNDTIQITTANAGLVRGDEGNDSLSGTGNTGTFSGSADNDNIQLTATNVGNVFGVDGDDTVVVSVNEGTISGGNGNDTLNGNINLLGASVNGDAGNDTCKWNLNLGTIDCETE